MATDRKREELAAARVFIDRVGRGPVVRGINGRRCGCHGCIHTRDGLAVYQRRMEEIPRG